MRIALEARYRDEAIQSFWQLVDLFFVNLIHWGRALDFFFFFCLSGSLPNLKLGHHGVCVWDTEGNFPVLDVVVLQVQFINTTHY